VRPAPSIGVDPEEDTTVGRKFLGKTYSLGGQDWYLETGHTGLCDACEDLVTPDKAVYRRTFGRLWRKRAHFVHEACMPEYALEMNQSMETVRRLREGR
jgi:hypothetical protein